jgi:amidase
LSQRPATKHAIPQASGLCTVSAVELARRIAQRELSSREVVGAFLDRIEAVNPQVNAIISLRPREDILRDAALADVALQDGRAAGPLHGLPIAIKDLARTKGLVTTFGYRGLVDWTPDEDDIHVERIRAAGAIIIGKTNTPEFGLGSQTHNQVFGATANAFDPALTSGGSSGGAAVAVALNMLPLADGSDFGGSLRNPAAYNNIYGFRPSQGLVPGGPRVETFFAQMGTEGPMGRNVADLALLLDVLAGYDPRSPLSHAGEVRYVTGLSKPLPPGGRIAWLGDLGGHLPMEAGVLDLCATAVRRFGELGVEIEPIVPSFDFEALWRAFVTLRQATSALGLKVHYDDPAKRALLKPEAIWEIESGLRLMAVDVYNASVVRTSWYRTVLDHFERYDFLALPTAQVFPFDIKTHWPREVGGRPMDSYHRWMEVVVGATMAGCPVINLPAGFDRAGRPMGLQLIGRPRHDLAVLRAAAAYEAICPWPAGA